MPVYEHTVVEGEHLGAIAGRYGVRRADLLRLNPEVHDPDLIKVGQALRVCPEILPRERSLIEYVVQPGDNLQKIAEDYHTSVRELVLGQRGRVKDPDRILVGQKLQIWVEGPVLARFEPFTPEAEYRREKLDAGVQLPPDPAYHIKRPHLAYGTPRTVRMIQQALQRYVRRRPGGPKIYIGDISRRGGGKLAPHVSHRGGRDVDIGYVRRGQNADNPWFKGVNSQTLDVARTWELIKAFVENGEVRYVFVDYQLQEQLYQYARSQGLSAHDLDEWFQYPRGAHRAHGIIRHWPSHKNHYHVRFR